MGEEKENIAKMIKYNEGDIILQEGERCETLLKIVSGSTVMYKNYKKNKEYLIGILSEHRYIGEVSFLTEAPMPYTIVADSDCILMTVSREEFEDYLLFNAGNSIDIMRQLAKTVKTLNAHIDMMSTELIDMVEKKKPIPIDLKAKLLQYKNFSI